MMQMTRPRQVQTKTNVSKFLNVFVALRSFAEEVAVSWHDYTNLLDFWEKTQLLRESRPPGLNFENGVQTNLNVFV